MKLVVGISGATGAIYGIRVLEVLQSLGVEIHLVLTDAGKKQSNWKQIMNCTLLKS